jgi:hypothetical protein
MLIYSIFDREELELARELRRQFRPAQQRIYTVVFSVRLCDQLFRNSLIHLDASRRGELTRARRPANRQVVRFYIPDTSLSDSITVTNTTLCRGDLRLCFHLPGLASAHHQLLPATRATIPIKRSSHRCSRVSKALGMLIRVYFYIDGPFSLRAL